MADGEASRKRPDVASALRFATEIVAWVATPWALAGHSVLLAVVADVILIGLPTILATPGDKATVIIPVPGYVTVAMVVLQLAAAAISSFAVWPLPVAVGVWALALATLVTELPRWRRLCGVATDLERRRA
ncbi:hypothetical protein GCM10023196_069870 [Actinoallomurus vinaceus]|uniref:Uncharacterized protein n=1 Tax=Actinoallomurus vinaceus TaxID=1080074 RepID=A0ABP8UJH6_9ACTN